MRSAVVLPQGEDLNEVCVERDAELVWLRRARLIARGVRSGWQ
jgi:hypothetical protein